MKTMKIVFDEDNFLVNLLYLISVKNEKNDSGISQVIYILDDL